MGALGVVYQCHRRCGKACQVIDFAGVVHAHLDHRGAMRVAQPEQGQRHADVVVQVAAGGQYAGVGTAEVGAQDGGAHFLDRGLAIAACDTQQGYRKAAAPGRRELPQRQARIVHGEQRQARIGPRPARLDQRPGSPGGKHVAHVVVTIETFALERDEQHARSDSPRITPNRAAMGVGAEVRHAEHRTGFREAHHRRISSADFAVARSEYAWRTPATS
jgi:hypothetical protein